MKKFCTAWALLPLALMAEVMVTTFDFDRTKPADGSVEYAPGVSGSSALFNGKSCFTIGKKLPAKCNHLIIECDVYVENSRTGTIVSSFRESGNKRSFNLGIKDGMLSFTVNPNGRSSASKSVSLPVQTGKFQHIRAEFVPGVMSLTVDGVTETVKAPDRLFFNDLPIEIGCYIANNKPIRQFVGKIDNLQITASDEYVVPPSLLANANDWSMVSGKWQIRDGIAAISAGGSGKYSILKYNKPLVADGRYWVEFDLSLANKSGEFAPEAYVVLNGKMPFGGFGAGLNRAKGKQLCITGFPQDKVLIRSDLQTGKKWGSQWQHIAVMVNGQMMEVYYPDNAVIRYINPALSGGRTLFLVSNDPAAQFRNLKITPLDQVMPVSQFDFTFPGKKSAVSTTDRPEISWRLRGVNVRDDLHFSVTISRGGKMMETGGTDENRYRIKTPLKPGKYKVTVTAQSAAGALWGGRRSADFTVPENAVKEAAFINVSDLTPKHFEKSGTVLSFSWDVADSFDSVAVLYQDQVIASGKGAAGKMSFDVPAGVPDGLCCFAIRFLKEGKVIEQKNLRAVKTVIPVRYTLRSDGVLLADGKVVFPFMTYRDPSEDRLQCAGLKEAGFNISHTYFFEGAHHYNIKKANLPARLSREFMQQKISEAREYLQFCHKNHIKAALGIRRSWVYNGRTDLIAEYVAALMKEPGLLTWYLYDEPDYVGVPLSRTRDAYRTIKEIDPFHPVSIIYANASWIPSYSRSGDILWSQAYETKGADLIAKVDLMAQMRRIGMEFSGDPDFNPRALWTILGYFDLKIEKNLHSFEQHTPNPQDIDALSFAAMIAPSRGICVYWLPKARYDIVKDTPRIWNAVKNAGKNINAVFPLLLEEGEEKVDLSGKVFFRVRQLADGRIVIVLLNCELKEDGRWSYPVPPGFKVQKLAGKGDFSVSGKTLNVTLPGNSGAAYLLSK